MKRRISSLVRAFLTPKTSLGDLDAASAATLLAAAADVALVIDADGVIRDLAFHSDDLAKDLPDSETWLGTLASATVAADSRGKVEALLRDAATGAPARWRHINHLGAGGVSIPVLYSAASLGGDGRVVAFGRDLRAVSALQQRLMNAQQSMERDYSRLREIEMRYRLLFQTSAEPVLIVDSGKLKVTEANPAALQLFPAGTASPIGRTLAELFTTDTIAAVQAHLGAVRAGARVDDVAAKLAGGGADVLASASLFRQENAALYLMRLTQTAAPALAAGSEVRAKLLQVVDHAPDGFVMTDAGGQIMATNPAFLDMAQLTGEEQARGESLDRWVGQSAVDLNVLIANLRQRGSVRFFATVLRGELGATTQVEISAVSIVNGEQPCFGFAIRNVGPRLRVDQRTARELPRSVEQLTELIGRVALKDLVREATDVIERLCIEAALELTGDNRASAAEMLGLSRQSLYVKLRRYGLGDLANDDRE